MLTPWPPHSVSHGGAHGTTKAPPQRRSYGATGSSPPDAAGLDVGAELVFAAVREDRAIEAIRNYPTFTSDLHAVADWLKECQVTTVAMESTGVYWIPVFQILETRGFDVILVNARHVRSVLEMQERRSRLRVAALPARGGLVAGLVPTA